MKKRVIFSIIGLLIIIGLIGGIKGLQIDRMIAQGSQTLPPPETVTTAVVQADSWESRLSAVGSLVAVQGVTVTAEVTGKVVRIAFEQHAVLCAHRRDAPSRRFIGKLQIAIISFG